MVVKIKKSLAIIAAVVLTLLFAVSTAVPAFAEESDTAQSNAQFEVVEPEYNGDANDYVTLPKAPEKEGYIFQGWSVDGSTKLYDAGETIANSDGHKIQIKPVYKATGAVHEDALIKCIRVLPKILKWFSKPILLPQMSSIKTCPAILRNLMSWPVL